MRTLITPKRVIELAFESDEYFPNKAISETVIVAAEERYLKPIVGEQLYEALIGNRYPSLRTDFVEPLIAVAVKRSIIVDFALRIGQCGVVELSATGQQSAGIQSKTKLIKGLRRRIATLSCRLSNELERCYKAGNLPEYSPHNNVHNHCRIYGNTVQTL